MNKCIDKFPTAFKISQSPYASSNFHKNTEKYCTTYNLTISEIKSSKVIVIGDVAVGKTSLIYSFCRQLFNSNYKATIGVDFEVEQFQILGVPFHLQIWDTAGQERFKCIAQSYYRYAQAIVVVFDLKNIKTLLSCKTWLNEALNSSDPNPFIFLVGTKKDLLSSAAYSQVEIDALKVANAMNAEYWSVSSKKGENVKKLFHRIAALTFDSIINKDEKNRIISITGNEIISLKKNKLNKNKNKNKCCYI